MKSVELLVEGWRKVVHFTDDASGLNALIAVHDATAAGFFPMPASKPALRM